MVSVKVHLEAPLGRLLWRWLLVWALTSLNGHLSQPLQQPPPSSPQKPDIVQTQAKVTLSNNSANGKLLEVTNNINPLIQAFGVPADLNSVASSPEAQQILNHSPVTAVQPVKTIASSTVEPGPSSAQSYGPDDPIVYVDYSTIQDEVLRKSTANFVYFNANFNNCRHCHRFFTVWKDLAVDIRWWRQVVRLFAINCSDEDNIEMCRQAGVTQFPQVKYYWIQSNSLDRDGQRLRILGKSVHAMRHLITDKVLDSYYEHNKLLAQQKEATNSVNQLQQNVASASGAPNSPVINAIVSPMISQLLSNGNGLSGGVGLNAMLGSLSGASDTSKGSLPLLNLLSGLSVGNGKMSGGLNQMVSAFMSSVPPTRKRLSVLPNNWPELDPIVATDTQLLISTLPLNAAKNIGALLVMETQEFLYTGLEVMLDLIPYGNSTYIARVRDDRSQLSKNLTKRDDIQAPTLIYIPAQGEPRLMLASPKYTNDEDLRRAFVRAFERRQVKYPVKRVWSVQSGSSQPPLDSPEDEDLVKSKVYQVYMNDLTNAIRASLMEQVFRHLDLSDDQYNALVKYVYTLINYFPFNNDESLKFFKRLHIWLQNQVSPMDIGEYKKQFHDIDEVFPQQQSVACRSLSNTKSIPSKSRKSLSLFENPSQLGKVVSNLTRLFRGQQKQTNSLLSLFTSKSSPVMLGQNTAGKSSANSTLSVVPTTSSPTLAPTTRATSVNSQNDSPMERIISSLTSGSLGSDLSILKLISTALTGGSSSSAGQGKSKFEREYPCGAWRLAHVMVVNEYIKDSPRKDVRHIVLHSLYQYMLHFYACPTCGNRISDVSGEFRLNLNDHLMDQADSVLLLWKVHNRVNKRLEAEIRPGSPPKLQFPSEQQCPKCRAQSDLMSTPNWHEKQVLNFLVHHYRTQNIIISTSEQTSSASSCAAATIVPWTTTNMLLLCGIYLLSVSSFWWLNGNSYFDVTRIFL